MTTTAEYQAALEKVGRRAQRDLNQLFSRINLDHPLGSRNVLRAAIPKLVARYGEATAAIAREWYDELRLIEDVPGGYRAALGEGVATEFIEKRVQYAAGHLFTDNPGAILPLLESLVQKYVMAPARDTIVRNVRDDPQAAGWQRVTSADACGFCVMLAGRGGVYKRHTVRFAAHDDCNCAAVPSWDKGAKEVPVETYRASARTSAMSEGEKAMHNAWLRDYLKKNGLDH